MLVSAITSPLVDEPPFTVASRSLKQAVGCGFKWDNEDQYWDKFDSELAELKEADTPERKKDEFGDVLHALVNIANLHNVDPQQALERANQSLWDRLKIRLDRFKRATSHKRKEIELGNILHALGNIANLDNIVPQQALRQANDKFISRFRIAEGLVATDGKKMSDLNLEQILKYWKLAKQQLDTQR